MKNLSLRARSVLLMVGLLAAGSLLAQPKIKWDVQSVYLGNGISGNINIDFWQPSYTYNLSTTNCVYTSFTINSSGVIDYVDAKVLANDLDYGYVLIEVLDSKGNPVTTLRVNFIQACDGATLVPDFFLVDARMTEIDPTMINGGVVGFWGNFSIDDGYTFSNTTFLGGANARMTVEDGINITFQDGVMDRFCDYQWDAVHVPSYGADLFIRRSYLHNSVSGVYFTNEESSVYIEDVGFEDNVISVNMDNVAGTLTGAHEQGSNIFLHGSVFDYTTYTFPIHPMTVLTTRYQKRPIINTLALGSFAITHHVYMTHCDNQWIGHYNVTTYTYPENKFRNTAGPDLVNSIKIQWSTNVGVTNTIFDGTTSSRVLRSIVANHSVVSAAWRVKYLDADLFTLLTSTLLFDSYFKDTRVEFDRPNQDSHVFWYPGNFIDHGTSVDSCELINCEIIATNTQGGYHFTDLRIRRNIMVGLNDGRARIDIDGLRPAASKSLIVNFNEILFYKELANEIAIVRIRDSHEAEVADNNIGSYFPAYGMYWNAVGLYNKTTPPVMIPATQQGQGIQVQNSTDTRVWGNMIFGMDRGLSLIGNVSGLDVRCLDLIHNMSSIYLDGVYNMPDFGSPAASAGIYYSYDVMGWPNPMQYYYPNWNPPVTYGDGHTINGSYGTAWNYYYETTYAAQNYNPAQYGISGSTSVTVTGLTNAADMCNTYTPTPYKTSPVSETVSDCQVENGAVEYRIFNMTGQLVKEGTGSDEDAVRSLSYMPKGQMFILHRINECGEVEVTKNIQL